MAGTGLRYADGFSVLFPDSGPDVAIATKDCFILTGLKWHSGSFAAMRTGYRKHLPVRAEVFAGVLTFGSRAFFSPAAGGTAVGRIDEAVRRMNKLFFSRKSECFSAIDAAQ
jgi:hypothetical protein